jgi:NAD(P)-dependent dehydrogenase (short-subunit alcohol dehydrogenase family)
MQKGIPMRTLTDKNLVVVGGSRGVGRVIVEAAKREGASVLAVARGTQALEQLARDLPGVKTLAADATEEKTVEKVLAVLPDVLVICAGSVPPTAPVHELSWADFSKNWETDVKASFLFCKGALRKPIKAGAKIILISSGAALGGSPISGGYAGAKRMQMFLAGYSQKESERMGLGLRFVALAPARIMPQTDLGNAAVSGYSRYLGISASAFIGGMSDAQTPLNVAEAVIELANGTQHLEGSAFVVKGSGVAPAP